MCENFNYDLVVLDAEMFYRVEGKPEWLSKLELAARFEMIAEQYPGARCVAVFSGQSLAEERIPAIEKASKPRWLVLRQAGSSAWDVIAWLARDFARARTEIRTRTLVVSDDVRAFGLLDDNTHLLYRSSQGQEHWTEEKFEKSFRFSPAIFWGWLAFIGGASVGFDRLFGDRQIRPILLEAGPVLTRAQIGEWSSGLPLDVGLQDEVAERLGLILPAKLEGQAALAIKTLKGGKIA